MAGIPVGAQGLKQAEASALMQGLRSNGPPPNPNTPNIREDPSHKRLIALSQVRVSLDKTLLTVAEDEPQLKLLLSEMREVVIRLLTGIEPSQVLQGIAAKLGAMAPAPMPNQMGQPAVPPGAPPAMPGGPPPGPALPGV